MGHPRALILLAFGWGCSPAAPKPYGEVLLNVDTNVTVPRLASELRVDSYAEDGTWFDSRAIGLPDAPSWPVSFSVYSADETRETWVWVRLRAFSNGAVRDYRGERFTTVEGPAPVPEGEQPRLTKDGVDVTPQEEPLPALSVDRLLRVRLAPGNRGTVSVLLDGSCAGRMAFLGELAPGVSSSCIAGQDTVALDAERSAGIQAAKETLAGTWGEPCESAREGNRICVPGGGTILGSRELLLYPGLPPTPERVMYVSRFWVDEREMSVARFRAALAQGFAPANMPTENPGALGPDYVQNGCTWSTTPNGREGYALNCVSQVTARALCQFLGGDLPTEAQWEYMATSAGRNERMPFPWGTAQPECERAVYGRLPLSGVAGVCQSLGTGPVPLDEGPGDVTPLGIFGLAGGMSEWTRDTYADYGAPCWKQAPLANPECSGPGANVSMRGGNWATPPTILRSASRLGTSAQGKASFIGFRCAYPGAA
ncbi:MAG: SUMF1/EgtB/PvdO family nonheme iron enzyme [Myxococcales bacterium]|nr:SUMF1/EgtB/PvdO family nonheme iron enzyme [Myxococcales bacterium]